MRETKIYKTWRGIVERCYNLKNKNYNDYGGRGIKCLWNSFENFRDDMYKSYLAHVKEFGEKNTSIDRINNNGNYCKENCRWATRVEQANNTRRNKIIILRGRAQTLSQWSKEKNISISTLWRRLKQGWSEEKTILTLIKK